MSKTQRGRWSGGLATAGRSAAPLIAAGLGAHAVIVGLTELVSSVPLLTALIATLVFAAINIGCTPKRDTVRRGSPKPAFLQLQVLTLAVIPISIGVWLIGHLFGTGIKFYCEPLVPWRIEIALLGSFAVGVLTKISAPRRLERAVYPLTMIAFLWIAPFYGFFSAPLFLGISLNSMCPDRPMVTVILVALGMLAGHQAGRAVAGWISAR